MSRSGYSDDCYGWDLTRWRGAVKSAFRGHRGQVFLRKLKESLENLPNKRLIAYKLEYKGDYCAIGSVGRACGIDMEQIDPIDHDTVAEIFDISPAMAREISYMNDERFYAKSLEDRWQKVYSWVCSQIRDGGNYV